MLCSVLALVAHVGSEQIHLAATGDETEMHVTWVTLGPIASPTVKWGSSPASYSSSVSLFEDSFLVLFTIFLC